MYKKNEIFNLHFNKKIKDLVFVTFIYWKFKCKAKINIWQFFLYPKLPPRMPKTYRQVHAISCSSLVANMLSTFWCQTKMHQIKTKFYFHLSIFRSCVKFPCSKPLLYCICIYYMIWFYLVLSCHGLWGHIKSQ